NEVRGEDGDEFTAGILQAFFQRASLVADAVGAMDELDVVTLGGPTLAGEAGDFGGLVGTVVEHLDFKAVARIVDLAGRPDHALSDGPFVVHGELDGDPGELDVLAVD